MKIIDKEINGKKIVTVLMGNEIWSPENDLPNPTMPYENSKVLSGDMEAGDTYFYTGESHTNIKDVATMHKEGRLVGAHRTRVEATFEGSYQKEISEKLKTEFYQQRRRQRRNEYDGEINLDAYMASDPNFYTKVERVKRKDKKITVLVNTCYGGNISASEITSDMSRVFAKVNNLIKQGFNVEIYAGMVAGGGWQKTGATEKTTPSTSAALVIVKEANMPIDRERFMCMAHSSFLRLVLFRAFSCGASIYNQSFRPTTTLGSVINGNDGRCAEWLSTVLDGMINTDKVLYFDSVFLEGIEITSPKLEDVQASFAKA